MLCPFHSAENSLGRVGRTGAHCQCEGLRTWLLAHQLKKYVMQFLMGLNDSCAQIRDQVLMMDPLASINHVFSLVI